jgi:hypothetical protein
LAQPGLQEKALILKLNIEFDVYVNPDGAEVSNEDLQDFVAREFREWSDGRRPFSVEMILKGLNSILEWSGMQAAEAPFRRRFGNRSIGRHIIATYLGEKRSKDLRIRVGEITDVKVSTAISKDDDACP